MQIEADAVNYFSNVFYNTDMQENENFHIINEQISFNEESCPSNERQELLIFFKKNLSAKALSLDSLKEKNVVAQKFSSNLKKFEQFLFNPSKTHVTSEDKELKLADESSKPSSPQSYSASLASFFSPDLPPDYFFKCSEAGRDVIYPAHESILCYDHRCLATDTNEIVITNKHESEVLPFFLEYLYTGNFSYSNSLIQPANNISDSDLIQDLNKELSIVDHIEKLGERALAKEELQNLKTICSYKKMLINSHLHEFTENKKIYPFPISNAVKNFDPARLPKKDKIVVGEKEILVNKEVLCARRPHFKKLFSKEKTLIVPEKLLPEFTALINHIYQGGQESFNFNFDLKEAKEYGFETLNELENLAKPPLSNIEFYCHERAEIDLKYDMLKGDGYPDAEIDGILNAVLERIYNKSTQLAHLTIKGGGISEETIKLLLQKCPNLESLDISKIDISEATAKLIPVYCPKIDTLKLEYLSPETKAFISHSLNLITFTTMEKLDISPRT